MLKLKSKTSKPSTSSPQSPCLRFKLNYIQKVTNGFHKSSVLGAGSFGSVYRAKVSVGGSVLDAAIKRLDPNSDQGATEFHAELGMLPTLRHDNILQLIGYCLDIRTVRMIPLLNPLNPVYKQEKEMILVYEHMPNRTLKEHLHELRTRFSCVERYEICLGVARGLYCVHTANGVHRDVKTSNVLFDKRWRPVISDFGLCVVMDELSLSSSVAHGTPKGTIGYMDPVYGRNGVLTSKCDVYSYGMVMLEILFRMLVLDDSRDDGLRNLATWVEHSLKEKDLVDIIDSDIRDEISPDCLQEYFEIVQDCLHNDPDMRPDMVEIMPRLESLLTLQKRFNNLKTTTRGLSQDGLTGEEGSMKVFSTWVDPNTHAPSNPSHGIPVAIKIVTSEIPWLEEGNFSRQLAHPNIIRLLGRCKDEQKHFLIYEHMEKSLVHYVHGDGQLETLSWKTRLQIMIGIVRGLIYLFAMKGILCHFQSEDILLDEHFNAKIGGYGWAKHLPEKKEIHDKIWLNGTFGYHRADYHTTGDLKANRLMVKNDICCFGMVFLETITGIPLTGQKESFESIMRRITMIIEPNSEALEGIIDSRLKGNYNPEGAFKCVTIALSCLAKQPGFWPSREGILKNLEEIYALG